MNNTTTCLILECGVALRQSNLSFEREITEYMDALGEPHRPQLVTTLLAEEKQERETDRKKEQKISIFRTDNRIYGRFQTTISGLIPFLPRHFNLQVIQSNPKCARWSHNFSFDKLSPPATMR